MDTPKRRNDWLVAIALCWALLGFAAAALAEEAQPLSIEAQVGGAWVRVLGTDRHHLLGGDPASPREVPDTAPLRLVGELANHLDLVDYASGFQLSESSTPTGAQGKPHWRASDLSLRQIETAPPELLSKWRPQKPEQAVLVCVWQVSGRPSHLFTTPLIKAPNGRLHTWIRHFILDPGEERGNPVFLLLEDGEFQTKKLPASCNTGERLAVIAALGGDDAAAAALQELTSVPTMLFGTPSLAHLCAQAGATKSLDILLAMGANPGSNPPHGNTALLMATGCGRRASVEALIKARVDLTESNNNQLTALHVAAAAGNTDLCRLLIEAGAPADGGNCQAPPPIRQALESSSVPTVSLLLAHKAPLDIGQERAGIALVEAAKSGNLELVNLLLTHGALPSEEWAGATALINAAGSGSQAIVETLLAAKADPNLANADGITPLLVAAEHGHSDILERLLSAGAKLGKAVPLGHNPLHAAALAGSQASMKALLAAGAKITPSGPDFDMEITSAISTDAALFVSAALKAGMSPNYRTARGCTVLQLAAFTRAAQCTQILNAAGAQLPPSTVLIIEAPQQPPHIRDLPRPAAPHTTEDGDGISQTVMIDGVIDPTGRPLYLSAECPDPSLNEASLQAGFGATFAPAIENGQPVAARIWFPVQFTSSEDLTFVTMNSGQASKPVPLALVPPVYPAALKKEHIEGFATVQFFITKNGSVYGADAVASSAPAFAASAVAAIKQWRFQPYIRNGKPVPCRMQQTIPFMLPH